MTVRRRPVFFDVLPNPGVEAIGPRAVVIPGLVDAVATDETTVGRGDHGTGRVARELLVNVTRRERVPVDRPDTSYKHVTQAFAAILGEHYREKFRRAHGLSEPAETACIGRLIDGRERCPHNVVAQDDDPNAPHHSPPGDGHSTLWLDEDGNPALYGMHVYQGNIEMRASDDPPDSWFSIVGFAEHYGLELSILPYSWDNFGRTVHVIFSPPERYR